MLIIFAAVLVAILVLFKYRQLRQKSQYTLRGGLDDDGQVYNPIYNSASVQAHSYDNVDLAGVSPPVAIQLRVDSSYYDYIEPSLHSLEMATSPNAHDHTPDLIVPYATVTSGSMNQQNQTTPRGSPDFHTVPSSVGNGTTRKAVASNQEGDRQKGSLEVPLQDNVAYTKERIQEGSLLKGADNIPLQHNVAYPKERIPSRTYSKDNVPLEASEDSQIYY